MEKGEWAIVGYVNPEKSTKGNIYACEARLDEVGLHDDSPWPGAVCPGRQ